MKEILDFLATSPAFYVATIDENNMPKVRPFSFVMEWKGRLTFVTNSSKKVCRQLEKNPGCEICSFDNRRGKWMRISGTVTIFSDVEANRKVFEVMPELKSIYESESNPNLRCFYFEKGAASIYSFNSMNTPERVIEF